MEDKDFPARTVLPASRWLRYHWILAAAWSALIWGFSVWGVRAQRAKHEGFIREIARLVCVFDAGTHMRTGGLGGDIKHSVRGVETRFTSLKPGGKRHLPDEWEAAALARIARGESEVSAVVEADGRRVMRLMHPLRAERGCLSCHAGYRKGDLRGGVAVTVPMDALSLPGDEGRKRLIAMTAGFWILGLAGIWLFARRTGAQIRAREELIEKLRRAMDEIRTLTGLLPICAWCKRVRDDKGYWTQVEKYVGDHTGAEFSHGICPECEAKMLAEIRAERRKPEGGTAPGG